MGMREKPDRRRLLRSPKILHSLRARLALGVGFPILIALTALSALHYWREFNLIDEQTRLTAVQIGEVALGSLRHAMLANDSPHLDQILLDLAAKQNILQVLLVDSTGAYVLGRQPTVDQPLGTHEAGCEECHQYPASERPRTAMLEAEPGVLRIASPIENEPACQACHKNASGHLGILLTDVSFIDTRAHLLDDLKIDLFVSAMFVGLVATGVYLLVQRLVIARVDQLGAPMAALAEGDFKARVDIPNEPRDELDLLLEGVNHLAEELEAQMAERHRQEAMRYQAIVDERERISREIHDSVAQLMGYVNTKSNAIRLLLEKGRIEQARQQLHQLSLAAKSSFRDLRLSILGLRSSDSMALGFIPTLQQFLRRFQDLSTLKVELRTNLSDSSLKLSPERELQLLRITQEALSNSLKHSGAARVWIAIRRENRAIELTIGDDGHGFDPSRPASDGRPHFGLNTMRERAESVGGDFVIDSRPGEGTRVQIRLPLEPSK